jgi:hypothetical protein
MWGEGNSHEVVGNRRVMANRGMVPAARVQAQKTRSSPPSPSSTSAEGGQKTPSTSAEGEQKATSTSAEGGQKIPSTSAAVNERLATALRSVSVDKWADAQEQLPMELSEDDCRCDKILDMHLDGGPQASASTQPERYLNVP